MKRKDFLKGISIGGLLSVTGIGSNVFKSTDDIPSEEKNIKQVGFNHIKVMETKT